MRELLEHPAVAKHYPFDPKTFTVGGGHRLSYLDEGEGDPVVMLHGNPSWSIYYRNLVNALRATHRCIVPDHIGMGLSDKPQDDVYEYRLERRVEDLDALLSSLGVGDNVTLVLHDWGGMIGMAWAAKHPEKIARIVVLNTAAFGLPGHKPLPKRLRFIRNTKLGAWMVRHMNAFARPAAYLCCTENPMKRELRAAYVAPYNTPENRIATLRFVQDIPLTEDDPSFALVKETEDKLSAFADTPMLILWGMKDFVFDADFLAEWERRFPKAEVHRYPRHGHYVLEDVGEMAVKRIKDWLPGGRGQDPQQT